MSRIELQPSFVLHRRPYRDTSLIIDVLTLEHGRVGVVARGVRGGKKNTATILEPFRQLLISWSGRGELFTMTGAEETMSDLPSRVLRGTSLLCGYYINELAVKLLPRDDAHPEIFAIYNDTLMQLFQSEPDVEPALRQYEITLLSALGYQIVLDHEVYSGDSIVEDRSYYYIPDRGPVLNNSEAAKNGCTVSGVTLMSLAQHDYSSEKTRRESRALLRMLIDHQLDGRPLKSRELFRALKNDLSTSGSNRSSTADR